MDPGSKKEDDKEVPVVADHCCDCCKEHAALEGINTRKPGAQTWQQLHHSMQADP